MDQSSATGRNIMIGLEWMNRKRHQKGRDYEEIDNILNTPFAMKYNMSYTQTAM